MEHQPDLLYLQFQINPILFHQRVKLATELSRKATGRTIYLLDEPTTGLHMADVDKLISVLQRLTDAGNSVLVIEENLTDALVKIRRRALIELKEAAYDLGCNAVIGVDFDYLTLDPETASLTGGTVYEPYVICVTANGNAVVIEKIED